MGGESREERRERFCCCALGEVEERESCKKEEKKKKKKERNENETPVSIAFQFESFLQTHARIIPWTKRERRITDREKKKSVGLDGKKH